MYRVYCCESSELWRERLAYKYVCDPAVPFEQQQQNRRNQRPLQELMPSAAPTGSRDPSLRAARRPSYSFEARNTSAEGHPNAGDALDGALRAVLTGEATPQDRALESRDGGIKLCSARASIHPASAVGPSAEEDTSACSLPHVGPQMTGKHFLHLLFCICISCASHSPHQT